MGTNSKIRIKSKSWEFLEEKWHFISDMPSVILKDKKALKSDTKNIKIETSFSSYRDVFSSVTVDITNKGRSPVWIEEVEFCRINIRHFPAKNLRMLIYNDDATAGKWLNNGNRPLLGSSSMDSDVDDNCSRLFTCVYNQGSADGIFLGLIPEGGRIFYNSFTNTGNVFRGTARVRIHIKPRTRIRIGRLVVAGGELEGAFSGFSSLFGRPRTSPDFAKNIGWNSWDYYLWSVNSDDIMENMRFIKKTPWLKKRLKYIVIDCGWSSRHGDWKADHTFPGGMKNIAGKIRRAGFIPGIWVAPFMVHRDSRIAIEHPELIVKEPDGRGPLRIGRGFEKAMCLDTTHPDSISFLHNLFTRLKKDGFRYFKTDYLSHVLIAGREGRFHNRNITPMEAFKRGIQTIRKAIGNDSKLLGCAGFIPEAGVGIWDACRMSLDISSYWSDILALSRDAALKSMFNGKTWQNDYDFLIVRSAETSKEKKINVFEDLKFFVPEKAYMPYSVRSGSTLKTEHEARVWASLTLVAGGSMVLSDRLSMLNRKGINLIKTVVENATGTAGHPLDFLHKGMSRIWFSENKSEYLIGIFNWSDRKAVIKPGNFLRKKGIHLKKAYELWSKKILSLDAVKLGPRDARVFKIKRHLIQQESKNSG
ncbi:alpha-galactosidase [bacterium]|nr:alpha-galactosidase [bacterium]